MVRKKISFYNASIPVNQKSYLSNNIFSFFGVNIFPYVKRKLVSLKYFFNKFAFAFIFVCALLFYVGAASISPVFYVAAFESAVFSILLSVFNLRVLPIRKDFEENGIF